MENYPLRSSLEASLAAEIRAELARRSIRAGKCAQLLGLSRQGFSMKLNGQIAFKAVELDILAKYLGLGSNEFFRRAEEAASARGHNNPLDGKDVA